MTIRLVRNVPEAYRAYAAKENLSHLSGRGTQEEITRSITSEILHRCGFSFGQTLLDVGGGDGTLAQLALYSGAARVTMTCLTTEETARAREALPGEINVERRVLPDLPLQTYDLVTCNGVLHLLSNEAELAASLAALAACVAPGGVLYLGELPAAPASNGRKGWGAGWPTNWLMGCWREEKLSGVMRGLKWLVRSSVSDEAHLVFDLPTGACTAQASVKQLIGHGMHEAGSWTSGFMDGETFRPLRDRIDVAFLHGSEHLETADHDQP